MKHVNWLAAGLALAVSGTAMAGDLSFTVTGTSDYDFRGVTQTANKPALQGSVDWAAANGLYVGAWASNVDFGKDSDANVEVDYYAGFAGGKEGGLNFDVGAVYYSYPGDSSLDYPEVSAGISYGIFEAKLYYSWDFFALNEDAYYLEGNVNVPLPQGFGVTMHSGYSAGPAFDNLPGYTPYFDWSVGLTKSIKKWNLELKWVDGSDWRDLNHQPGDVLSSDARLVFSVSTTLPWKD